MLLYDARCLHRFDRDVTHHHTLFDFPHDYERVAGKFQHVAVMREYLLHHSADVAVQSFCQFGRTSSAGLRILFREIREACGVIMIDYMIHLISYNYLFSNLLKQKDLT